MQLREATAAEAEEIADVLRRSIVELCGADHGGDAATVATWTANKTAESVRDWMAASGAVRVAVSPEDVILGVGAAAPDGTILLNYVAPEARFTGVSKAVLAGLEAWLVERGVTEARLNSTRTAHTFYRARGYSDDGPAVPWLKASAQPMRKSLSLRMST
ncbi:GNAT family N-acetyltransferase [Stappia sp. WLB 29]|uniref:GNAT family N-acetyltransferase n=1 Tax=Stappia sp. WLB 29 TaxID=2925220 RepID=UPI0020BDB50C|nr:GNAT family N-acetyltransferase [Stappia sp. WLB 29]